MSGSGAAPEQLRSGSGAAPEPSGARLSTEGGSYEPLRSSSGWLHTFHLLCSTLLHLAPELLWSRSRAAHPNLPSKLTPLAPLLRSSSGAALLAIIFTCKIKLLRSQKQSSSPKNPNKTCCAKVHCLVAQVVDFYHELLLTTVTTMLL